jgi:putative heme-binding domain-containing protein
MEPAAGVVPYAVRVEPWMDGARAKRWVAIPGAGTIQLAGGPGEAARYPEGTVLVKHLTLPQGNKAPIRLETQVLQLEEGVWNPYSYLWDDAGREAHLVDSVGASRTLLGADSTADSGWRERTWRVSATNECKLCHNAGPGFVLGFVRNQLDHFASRSQGNANGQLAELVAQGVLSSTTELAAGQTSPLVDPHDAKQSLDDRARSYLHANCSMCHHPGGNAIVSFFLRRDLPFEKLNTNKGTGIGTFGIRDARIIAPGDPYRSLLLYRMAKLGYARMPYIGSQVVDSSGVALVEAWIKSLPAEAEAPLSAPLARETAAGEALSRIANPATSRGEREAAIGEMLTTTESSLALVARVHAGMVLRDGLQSAVALGSKSARSDVRGLFDTFVPEDQRRATLGTNIDPQTILSRKGDWERGTLIFFSDGARCRACHEQEDARQSLGPTLLEIKKKYARPAELLQHALQPSLKIDDLYAAYSVITSEGRAVQGLLAEQNDQAIVIKTTDKKLLSIARDNVAEMQKSPKSLMPDGIFSDLTAQEAADLLEFLQSPGGAP